ncbi:MAG: EscU/YscU/HrcU family type III secretion system export apparatus switch protein, partial [Planctomycetota bacterium]
MADEDKDQKTEEATPKKRQEARSKGQVAQSQKFIAACMLLATIGVFVVLGPRLASSIGQLVPDAARRASDLARADLSASQLAGLLLESGSGVAVSLAVFAGPVLFVGFLVSYGQVGFQLTPKAMQADLNKLNPISGFKKILGPRGFMRTGLGILEIIAIGGTIAFITWSAVPELALAAGTDAGTTAVALGRTVLRAATAGAVVFLAI